jgi:hypothetical protein
LLHFPFHQCRRETSIVDETADPQPYIFPFHQCRRETGLWKAERLLLSISFMSSRNALEKQLKRQITSFPPYSYCRETSCDVGRNPLYYTFSTFCVVAKLSQFASLLSTLPILSRNLPKPCNTAFHLTLSRNWCFHLIHIVAKPRLQFPFHLTHVVAEYPVRPTATSFYIILSCLVV